MLCAEEKVWAHRAYQETPVIPDELAADREARFVTDSLENFLEVISLGLYRA
jgi:hypothetical protein